MEVRADASAVPGWLEWAALALLASTVVFNFALAWINHNVVPVTAAQLVAVQGLLLAAAFGLGVLVPGRDRSIWLLLLWGMVMWWLLLSLLRGVPNPKYLGDIATFPALALLGAVVRPRRFVPLLIALQILVVAVGFWEALMPAAYGGTLDVSGYYVNTRGLNVEEFREDLGGLYLNAERPVGRLLLPQTGWHRISSVFLEPVSLGNWTVVVTVLLSVFWRRMDLMAKAVLIGGNLILLVMCDGRLALLGNIATVLFALLAPRLPRVVPLVLPLVMFGALAAARGLGALPSGGDTLTGRLSKGLYYFERLSLTELMGVAPYVPGYTFDSGWAYFTKIGRAHV